ncbi:MAG: translocation/assembly module TamB domain-containing protein, partial [Myxococcales bacterium]|nr:translocation/assembly module TamB domain-containing protein [Myxococcales bacterium]
MVPPAPVITGTLVVNAPKVGVAQLAPGVVLPDDIAAAFNIGARAAPWTHVSMMGRVGLAPVRILADVNLEEQKARGVVASGTLDLTALTRGKVVGLAGGVVMFEAATGETGALPTASGVAAVWGEIAEASDARASIAFDTRGDKIRTVVGARGEGLRAALEGQITKAGDVLRLDRGTVIASSSDPASATGGKAPVRGVLNLRLAASGQLSPSPNLAVSGRLDGRKLRFQDLRADTVRLAIDARQLPRQPIGKAELDLHGLVRGEMQLGELKVTAGSRDDHRIAVSVRSRPKQNPWLLDVDALVTPPGRGDVTVIDLVNHHVRAGTGGNWYGDRGRIELGSRRIVVRDLESRGANGVLAIAGELNRRNGDFIAKVGAQNVTLDSFDPAYRGAVDARIDLARVRGRISGTVDVTGKGMALGANPNTFDITAKVTAAPDRLVVDASASSTNLGAVKLALDVAPPRDLTNAEQWKHLHRKVIRTGRIAFERVDAAQAARALGRADVVTAGRIDGDLVFSADTTGGVVQVRDLALPALKGTGVVNADLQLSQTAPDELQPTLQGAIASLGRFTVSARLAMPDHLFDPAAWSALGARAVRGATARLDDVPIDPAQLERLGITTNLRGRATLAAEVTEGMRGAQLALDVKDLRGHPIAQPVDASLAIALDDRGGNATLAVRSGTFALLGVKGTLPVTLGQVLANPGVLKSAPLNLTASLPKAPAPRLLGVFGRAEVTGGTLDGTVRITGTLAKPEVVGKITGTNIQVPPGPRNRPVKVIESIVLDGTWDGTTAKVALDGVQQGGTLQLAATANTVDLAAGSATIEAKDFDLAPLLAFAPGPAGGGRGRLNAKLDIRGLDPKTMRVAGELHLADARMPLAPQIGTLRRAKLDIEIGQTEMTVRLDGRLGGGTVSLASRIQLDGATPRSGAVNVKLREVSPIGTVEPDISADISANLRNEGSRWVADVFVKNGDIVIPEKRRDALDPIGMPKDMVFASDLEKRDPQSAAGGDQAPPARPTLVVNVTLYSTSVISEDMRTLIKGRVTLTADAASVGVVGNIEADRGDVTLFGRRYAVERAAVRFDGSTDPLLDVRISHDFPEVTTITTLRGRLSSPELIMSSDPGLYSQGQLLGFLLGGEPSGDPSGASARDKATAVGTSFVANQLGGYVKKALPIDIDVLRYEAATASSSAAVLVGTWVTRSLFVAFRQHVDARVDENRSEAEVEYWLSRRVSVEAVAGDRSVNGVDLLWRKRY